jgi:hypothetical protein
MTLMDAKEYDASRDRRKRMRVGGIILLVLVLAGVGWAYRNWPEEHEVSRFFAALQGNNFEAAYGIWMHDANWQQHPQNYARYPYNEFYRDWGPGGEWGVIRSYKVYASGTPPGGASGVVVEVVVNDRAEHARVWVQKSDKTLSFSPY